MKRIQFEPSKWFLNNRFVLVLSLIIAFVFWLIITITATDDMQIQIQGVKINIPETTSGLEPVGEYQKTVSVVVSGRWYVVSTLTPEDITVTASVNDVTESGTYTLQLTYYRSNQLTTDFNIQSISTNSIAVHFDLIQQREFDVVPRNNGVAAKEGLTTETATIAYESEKKIEIQGPQQTLNNIDKVVALVDEKKTIDTSTNFTAEILLYDANDNLIDPKSEYLTLSIKEVAVTIPVSQVKTVTIEPVFVNTPKDYEKSPLKYTLSVSELEVIGPPSVIKVLESVSLTPIDFKKIGPDSISFECEIEFPASVRSTNNLKTVTVKISLSGIHSKTFKVTQFDWPDDTNVNTPESINSVVVMGPKESLERLTASNITAKLDLTNKEVGQNEVDVTMIISGFTDCWVFGDYHTIVTIHEE